jgi:hypothetical protein
MAQKYTSPQVAIIERDLSNYIAGVATSIGMYVGDFPWGPVYQNILVSSERGLTDRFGEPTDNNYEHFFSCSSFLRDANQLQVTRVVDKATALNSELDVTSSSVSGGAGDYIQYKSGSEILNSSGTEFSPAFSGDLLRFYGKYPGLKGNTDFKVALINNTNWNNGTLSGAVSGSGLEVYVEDAPETTDEFVVIVSTINDAGTFDVVEVFTVSTTENKKNGNGDNMYVEELINNGSSYIIAQHNTAGSGEPYSFDQTLLTSGTDGTPGTTEFSAGYDLYDNPEDIDINIVIGGSNTATTLANKILTLCSSRQDAIGVLDFPKSDLVNVADIDTAIANVINYRDTELNANSSYGALYANWVKIYDKYNDKERWVPSSGYVAGIYARTDFVTEPWFAPAGLNRGVISGEEVLGLAINPSLPQRDELYRKQINPLIVVKGVGNVVFGQKTLLSKSSAFDRVNVRRLFMVLEKAIGNESKYFQFEQNDEFSRTMFVNIVEPFLEDIRGRRGIDVFTVDVSTNVNTPARIDNSEFWADIYITPIKSAETIVLRFNSTKSGTSFEELLGGGA